MSHIIKKQILDISLQQGDDPWLVQNELKLQFETEILPALDRVCTELGLDNGVTFTIDQLELDLGIFQKEELSRNWATQVINAFRKEMIKLKDPFESQALLVGTKTDEVSQLEILEHFLRTGTLTWWAKKAEVHALPDLLDNLISDQPSALKQLWKRNRINAKCLERLVMQFDETLVKQVIELHFNAPQLVHVQSLHGLLRKAKVTQNTRQQVHVATLLQAFGSKHSRLTSIELLKTICETLVQRQVDQKPLRQAIAQWLKTGSGSRQAAENTNANQTTLQVIHTWLAVVEKAYPAQNIDGLKEQINPDKKPKAFNQIPKEEAFLPTESHQKRSSSNSPLAPGQDSYPNDQPVVKHPQSAKKDSNAFNKTDKSPSSAQDNKVLQKKEEVATHSEPADVGNVATQDSGVQNKQVKGKVDHKQAEAAKKQRPNDTRAHKALQSTVENFQEQPEDQNTKEASSEKQSKKEEGLLRKGSNADKSHSQRATKASDSAITPTEEKKNLPTADSQEKSALAKNIVTHEGAQSTKANEENDQEHKVDAALKPVMSSGAKVEEAVDMTSRTNELQAYAKSLSTKASQKAKSTEAHDSSKKAQTAAAVEPLLNNNLKISSQLSLEQELKEQYKKKLYGKEDEKQVKNTPDNQSASSIEVKVNNAKADVKRNENQPAAPHATQLNPQDQRHAEVSNELSPTDVEQDEIKARFAAFRTAWENGSLSMINGDSTSSNSQRSNTDYQPPAYFTTTNEEIEECYVSNAGLVFFWPYLTPFFTNLGLLDGQQFKSESARKKAILALQYLVSDAPVMAEHQLPLNKLLCGLPLNEPLENSLELSPGEKEACLALLESVTQNWPAMQGTSIEGFQQTFVQREGVLKKFDYGWQLQVEKMTFDMLMESLPWQIGVIKTTWMEQPIYTEW